MQNSFRRIIRLKAKTMIHIRTAVAAAATSKRKNQRFKAKSSKYKKFLLNFVKCSSDQTGYG